MMDTLKDIVIKHGKHKPQLSPTEPFDPRSVDACVMEWVYIVDCLDKGLTRQQIVECWTDRPPCASPTVSRILTRYNDSLPSNKAGDERRTRVLRQVIHDVRQSGYGSLELENRRRWAAIDWSLRFAAPLLLRRAQCVELAAMLEQMPGVSSDPNLREVRSLAWAVRNRVWDMRMFAFWRLAGVMDHTMDTINTGASRAAVLEAMAPLMMQFECAKLGPKAAIWEAAGESTVLDYADSIFSCAATTAALNAVASLPADDLLTIGEAAKKEAKEARSVVLEVFDAHDLRDGANAMIADLDAEFVAMIQRLCAMKEDA